MRTTKTNLDPFFKTLFDLDLFPESKASNTNPKVNISESQNDYEIQFAIPGYKKEDLNVNIENEMLVVSASIKEEIAKEGETLKRKMTRKEFSSASFKRSFHIPEPIAEDKIEAIFENGILTLALPKVKKEESKKSIAIK